MTKTTAEQVLEAGAFLRSEWLDSNTLDGWPGLPNEVGRTPTLEGANYFFIGCCVDFMTITKVAWDNARRFCKEKVPAKWQPRMWEWIANHSEDAWAQKRVEYGLHRFPVRHQKLHAIAKIVQERFAGDARRIWATNRSRSLLETLETDLKVGPAIARMIIGALRDHQLVALTTGDFKPDIHVRRLMKEVGLSQTTKVSDVMKSAGIHFPVDPWVADACFYTFGASYGVKTKKAFWAAHSTIQQWIDTRTALKQNVPGLLEELCGLDEEWSVYPEFSPHWVGAYLVKETGGLAEAMNQDEPGGLWPWVGVGYEGPHLTAGLYVGGGAQYFPAAMIEGLKHENFEEITSAHASEIGEREYWAGSAVSADALKRGPALRRMLAKQVATVRRIVTKAEAFTERLKSDGFTIPDSPYPTLLAEQWTGNVNSLIDAIRSVLARGSGPASSGA